jgi:hypothetical protein
MAKRHRPLRARKFYAVRHTFISIGLTAGVNLKWLGGAMQQFRRDA